ncbi:ATP-binding protein [Streptomyces sp. CBMA29]|uniref:ATP-binding protein n=1 Tax=Streptomyces sp. CBMA29 TaxID=1896314 RepID=UPI001661B7B5|nr:ATP-binding protein [Streptomyces sp. CBMA29]MBD0739886.1 histidine kinase [Streptomyces sp. CBMA29]
MTSYLHDPALWGLIAGTPVAATAIALSRKTNAKLRAALAEQSARRASLEVGREQIVDEARRRAEEGTKSVLKAAMRTLQGLAGEQQVAIAKLQRENGEHAALQGLLDVDHGNAQFTRRAQSIAVLCDGWLGRRKNAASVYDVVRSAKGRIRHFTRVEIRSQSNFAVVSRAVEPVALALSELLDNATSYSAPETSIEINIQPVPKGVCIVVDDAGVGMSDEEKTLAGELLTGQSTPGVSGLGNPPQFGFAVIGVLANRYGFSVSVDSTSPYGGVRAVLLLPDELLTTTIEPEETPVVGEASEPVEQSAPEPVVPATTFGGLPKRRRFRHPISIVPTAEERSDDRAGDRTGDRAGDRAERAPEPVRDSHEVASRMGAFQRGTQSGRRSIGASSEGQDAQ